MNTKELRRLASRATAGPWEATGDDDGTLLKGPDHEGSWDALLWESGYETSIKLTTETIAYIAAAHPGTVIALLDAIEAMAGEIAQRRQDAAKPIIRYTTKEILIEYGVEHGITNGGGDDD